MFVTAFYELILCIMLSAGLDQDPLPTKVPREPNKAVTVDR